MKTLLLALIVLLLGGCASFGLATPQNLDQKLAYTYAGVTTALNTIAAATTTGQLSSTQATNANDMVLNVKSLLDAARASETINVTTAQNDLNLAIQALTAVQSYLIANGVKK